MAATAAAVSAVINALITERWMTARDLEGTARIWTPLAVERLRRAHRGTHPFGVG